MIAPQLVLGVITARGGSKGLPGKNLKLLGGKPLLQYTADAARRSKYLTDTIVSTDSTEIADVARLCGVEVPFLRPADLAQDATPHLPVLQHAVREMEAKTGRTYEFVVTLQPTSPFRLPEDIDRTIEMLVSSNADSAVSVCEVESGCHPVKAKRFDGHRLLPYCVAEMEGTRRQDLPPAYKRNSAVYVSRRDLIVKENRFYGDHVVGYVVPRDRSIDIDSPLDWIVAEYMLEQLRRNNAFL